MTSTTGRAVRAGSVLPMVLPERHQADLQPFHEKHQADDGREQAGRDDPGIGDVLAQDDELEHHQVDP